MPPMVRGCQRMCCGGAVEKERSEDCLNERQIQPASIGIAGTPPAYLSVNGHENCLGTYEDGPATLKCLPVDKPSACTNVAWNELINVWEGEECPEDYGFIDNAIGGIGGNSGISGIRITNGSSWYTLHSWYLRYVLA